MNIDTDLILKYNKPGPRYTSYPPANFFTTDYTVDNYKEDLMVSNEEEPQNISLYFHVPFCPQLCHFCGCNTSKMENHAFVERYMKAMVSELETVAELLDNGRNVSQIHWGGGTPNSISLDLIAKVMDVVSKRFSFIDDPEVAMECNPAYLDMKDISKLASMGFNRISLGIQDFNSDVLNSINRRPPKHPIDLLVSEIRKTGIKGVNVDLIYGLPLQTVGNFTETLEKTLSINPDRIVTFSYAHVPWVKEGQKILEKVGLPGPSEKLALFVLAMQKLTGAGYHAIGMDHYAKKEDHLKVALDEKMLHRNFQGYCTRETTGQVYGFGCTSITQLHKAYSQNSKSSEDYVSAIEGKDFAVERGYRPTENERLVRDIINELMCNAYLDFNRLAETYKISVQQVKEVCQFDPVRLDEFIEDGLLRIEGNKIVISDAGRMVVRNIAMCFDPALKTGENIYSKTV